MREAAVRSTVWVTIGVASGARIRAAYGAGPGQRYVAAHVIEEYLAVDDVFV